MAIVLKSSRQSPATRCSSWVIPSVLPWPSSCCMRSRMTCRCSACMVVSAPVNGCNGRRAEWPMTDAVPQYSCAYRHAVNAAICTLQRLKQCCFDGVDTADTGCLS